MSVIVLPECPIGRNTLTIASRTAVTLSFFVTPCLPASMFLKLDGNSFADIRIPLSATYNYTFSSTEKVTGLTIYLTVFSTFLKTTCMTCLC